jgi:integrase
MAPKNDLFFRTAKPGTKPYKLSDGGGLHILVQVRGSKLWHLAYRFDGKQKLLSFGKYPLISLSQARELRDEAKKLLAEGIDPSAVKKAERRQRSVSRANTFKAIAAECLAKWKAQGDAQTTLDKKEWMLDFVIADLGNMPIADMKAADLLSVLRKIEANGRHETATRVRGTVGAVFRYAVATGRADRDISTDLRGALITPTTRHHPAITEPKKIGGLLRAIDGFEGHPTTQAALKLAPLLFVRPGELRMAEWSEFDLKDRVWRIPAAKMKMRRDHIVPLSKQALQLISAVQSDALGSKYVFPSVRSAKRPMSENTLNAALRRLGYSSTEMTAHGFRSMASTRLNESDQFSPDVIERQLAHQEQNEIRRAYNSAEHLPERTRMMQYWADYLDGLRADVTA